MRSPFAFCFGPTALVLAVVASTTAAEPGFPYKAYITTDNVLVRSGPGENYYPTDKLKPGAEVEVYRNDPGGWLAIRPPRGSFSWVRTHSVQFDRDTLAIASEDRAAVRVGSNLSDARDVIQVRLQKGESVELFDIGRRGPGNVNQTNANDPWCKISPPAGEFRWVPGRFVNASFPKDGLARSPIDNAARASISAAANGPAQPLTAFQRSLSAIDLELSAMVAEPSEQWEFTDLRNRTQVLFDNAGSPLERGRTRAVLARIAKFEDIRRRETALAAAQAAMPAGAAPAGTTAASTIAPSTIGPSQANGRYDAEGQLARVPEPAPGGPQYAILDASGKILCYVSPAPGVNLRSYIGHEVGITGVRGYMPEQRATHIMARHVSVVEGAVTR